MTPPSGFVVAVFYHALPPSAVVSAVPRLLTAFNSATREVGLLRYAVSALLTSRSDVTERVDASTLERLTAAVAERRLLSVDFCERAPSEQTSVVPAQLHLSLPPKAVAPHPDEAPFEVIAFFPRRLVTSTDAFVGAVSDIAEMLGTSYAFVHAGPDAEMVQREASAMAATNFLVRPSPEVREWAERLDHVQVNRRLLGAERIRGAYWGTFLAPHLLERLGGLAAVRASAPVEKVEVFSGGIVYLQLTADVWDYERADFPEKLARLERYLEPISLLSVERIATPRFQRWDRSTRT